MAIATITQTKDIQIIVMNHVIGKPSFLILNSARIVNARGQASLKNTAALSANLSRAINSIGQQSVQLAQDYLTPGNPSDVNSLKDAYDLLSGLVGKLNAMLSTGLPAGTQKRMADIAASEMDYCFAYTVDHSYGINAPRLVLPTGPLFGFFEPNTATRMNALPGRILPDVSVPSNFIVYGKR